ncbi:ankyrin, partial [Cenococcum geophilum 1.58]|uniref:ankyrin n=1 Tax=Cenococcum geophilum 1.58 TaxID=794803 RepID=UPI00358F13E6
IQLLIKAGADINAKDNSGWTPLFLAAKCLVYLSGNLTKLLNLLLKLGADISLTNNTGATLLYYAVAYNYSNKDILHALTNHKLDINRRDFLRDFPLYITARLRYKDIMSFLLDLGAELELQDRLGNTPLMLAAEARRVKVLKKLIKRGANVSHTNRGGATALHLIDTLETTQALISAGAGINVLDNELRTPLHRQVGNGLAIAQCLLDAGANVNFKDSDGESPLHIASAYEKEMLKLMLKYYSDMTLTNGVGRTPL